ncbi:transcriptional regulator [Ignicoccus pacificus DSM 13166]|uniref:Transcriptional regulator n=1 Tax=Ignicoccus pacificus DSM 13166 TaxID=940294 RepID=A0A977K9A8_9CREN|nr:transcriptional regulator [Ignicoccus pacificus DSM 13166]
MLMGFELATSRRLSPTIGFVKNASQIDDKDKAIIDILVSNSKTTTTEIANRLSISDVATRRRIKKLEDGGVIRFYTTVVDPYKLGYNAVVELFVEVDPKHIESVAKELSEKDFTTNVITVTGQYSVIAEIWVRNHNELVKAVQEVGQIEGVRSIVPVVVTSVYKINGINLKEKERRTK